MSVFVNYFLEANIGLVFFYMINWLLLRKENQFSVKRAFLVGSLIASLLFPLFSIGNSTAFIPSISKAVPATWLPEMIVYGNGAPEMSAEGEFTIGWTFLSYLYLIAAAIFTLLFLFRIVSLIKLFKHSRHYTWKTYTIAESSKVQGIFSFFNFIFFNPVNHLSALDKQEILRHEEVHIQRLHSLDIMLIELIGIIFWLNPIILGYKKSLVQLHEFEADARSVKDHDEDRYCHVLAKVALQNNGYVLANHFTNSFTLKRITMIKTIRTKIRSWKILALAAALPLFFLAVACQDQIANELANSTISQVSAFPPEAKADMAIWLKKYPGSIFNYVEGSDAELKKKLHSYSNTQAILN
ncbi:MAG: M56 family metallopeptidase, partial [Cyclobacteriaceae bacterium]